MSKNNVYSEEFRIEAAKLVNENGYSLAQASDKLGINKSTLYTWVKKYKKSTPMVAVTASQELRELRKRVKQQDNELQILKKAAAYFAKESL